MDPGRRPEGFKVWLRVVRCYQRGHRRLAELLTPLDLSPAQLDILANLHAGPSEGLIQEELVQRLLVTKGNVSGLLDRMCSRGWVERLRHPEDRRSKRVVLTESGRALADRAVGLQWDFVSELMSTLQHSELDQLDHALARVEDRLESWH